MTRETGRSGRRGAGRLLIMLAFAVVLCASVPVASAYVLDSGTGSFTNPPVGGWQAQVTVGGTAASANPLISSLVHAGVRYWDGVPESCAATGLTVQLSTDDPDAGDDPEYSGWVYDDNLCVMYLNVHNDEWPIRKRNSLMWCQVVTHEMGHMYGLAHSRNKRNIMFRGWIPYANPECNRFSNNGRKYLPKLDDPYYTRKGQRRTDAQRAAYEQRRR